MARELAPADSDILARGNFCFRQPQPVGGSQGDAFTSCSRNSTASALWPVFSSRAAAGSRFSNGLPTTTTRRRSNSTAPDVSPAAMRISARPRKFAASSLCSSISRANTNSSTLRADCLSPDSNSCRAADSQDFRGQAQSADRRDSLNPGIEGSKSAPRPAVRGERCGRRFHAVRVSADSDAIASPATAYCFVATRYFIHRTCQERRVCCALSLLQPFRLRHCVLLCLQDALIDRRALRQRDPRRLDHIGQHGARDRPRLRPSPAASRSLPPDPQSQHKRCAAARWSGSCRCGEDRRAEAHPLQALDR